MSEEDILNIQEKRMFFLGAGSMGQALMKGFVEADLLPADHITVSNRKHPARLDQLHLLYGVNPCKAGKVQEIANAHILVLAMKPHDLLSALQEIAPVVTADHLIVSLVAGASTAMIEHCLGRPIPVCRAMPNTASQVRASATAIAKGLWATENHLEMVYQIFSTIGTVTCMEECYMNVVTGISGSGPAYFYYIIEALMSAGQASGLSEETCRSLLIQTIDGVVQMLRKTGIDPATLRQQVTSPNGTTMAAISVLEQANVSRHFIHAVQSATWKAEELNRQFAESLPDFGLT
jgi:pyrroline-5-carboxylate reductase